MEYYWDTCRKFLEQLEHNGKFELVEELKDAQKYVNGLTDGWYEYLIRLKAIYKEFHPTMNSADSEKLKYLVDSIDSMLENR